MKKNKVKQNEEKVGEIETEVNETLPQTTIFRNYQRIIRGKKYIVQAIDMEHANQLLDVIENNIY